jgi:hypothetical protein
MTFIVFKKLAQDNAQNTYDMFKEFFKNNPRRKKCNTNLFSVRRGHVKEDLLEHCEDGVEIEE